VVRAMCPIWAERRVGVGLPVRPDCGRSASYKLLNVDRRYSQGVRGPVDVDRSIDVDGVVRRLECLAGHQGAPRSRSASITGRGRGSSPTPSPTGAGSTAPTLCSSTPPACRGRTPGSSPATADYTTSSAAANSSTRSWRPGSSSRTGASTTTDNPPHTRPTADLAPTEFVQAWLN